ncbi:MAG: type 3 dihydrofolate reductase [Candidatus Sungbacteria bacterium]|nr:type 3 dihydrofolate reductase [Candidatus Sungbacteria bacterium]
MIISLIAAIAKNNVIGKGNTMLWKLSADMKRFRELTIGKPIIMGRKTYESIGRPLPERVNIILTRDKSYLQEGCIVVHSVDEALQKCNGYEEAMVIGGGEIYKLFLPRATRMYLTLVDHDFEGDTYFPEFSRKGWQEIFCENYGPGEKNIYPYTFIVLRRTTDNF